MWTFSQTCEINADYIVIDEYWIRSGGRGSWSSWSALKLWWRRGCWREVSRAGAVTTTWPPSSSASTRIIENLCQSWSSTRKWSQMLCWRYFSLYLMTCQCRPMQSSLTIWHAAHPAEGQMIVTYKELCLRCAGIISSTSRRGIQGDQPCHYDLSRRDWRCENMCYSYTRNHNKLISLLNIQVALWYTFIWVLRWFLLVMVLLIDSSVCWYCCYAGTDCPNFTESCRCPCDECCADCEGNCHEWLCHTYTSKGWETLRTAELLNVCIAYFSERTLGHELIFVYQKCMHCTHNNIRWWPSKFCPTQTSRRARNYEMGDNCVVHIEDCCAAEVNTGYAESGLFRCS